MRKGEAKSSFAGLWKHPRTGIYWYRIAVPKQAQAALSKTAINQTLDTRDRQLAIERWGGVNAEWRSRIRAATSLDARSINDDTARSIAGALWDWPESEYGHDRKPYASQEAFGRAEIAAMVDEDLAEKKEATIDDEGSWIDFTKLTKADREAIVTAIVDQRLAMFVGLLKQTRNQADQIEAKFREVAPKLAASLPGARRLMDAYETWKASGNPRIKTQHEFESACKDFIMVNGDLPLVDLTEDHFVEFKKHLDTVKSARTGRPLAQMTRNKRMGGVKAVVQSAIDNRDLKAHPGANVVVAKGKKSKLRVDGLFDHEIEALFTSPVYTEGYRPANIGEAAYWVPILAFFTGARQSELCQLMVADVVKRDGIVCLRITDDEAEGQHVKTEGSIRLVPLADKVIDLGFNKYVATLNVKGKLFPEVKADVHGVAGGLFSKWYGKYRREIGLDRKGSDFHAIRHLAKTALRGVAGDGETKLEITGHSSGNVSAGYGRVSVRDMKKIVDQIAYDVTIPKWKPSKTLRNAA